MTKPSITDTALAAIDSILAALPAEEGFKVLDAMQATLADKSRSGSRPTIGAMLAATSGNRTEIESMHAQAAARFGVRPDKDGLLDICELDRVFKARPWISIEKRMKVKSVWRKAGVLKGYDAER